MIHAEEDITNCLTLTDKLVARYFIKILIYFNWEIQGNLSIPIYDVIQVLFLRPKTMY